VGRASRQRRRRARAVSLRDGVDRIAPPHDREERDLDGIIVPGSDHLTAYNLYAEAFAESGSMGSVYGLPRHVFDEEKIEAWASRRGALVKSIEDAALGMASIYRAVGLPLPAQMPNAGEHALRKLQSLLAQYMPFTLVIDERTADGDEARVSKTSVCGSWGPITGEIRYFADKFGNPRASIEGTQIPYDLLRPFATVREGELVYNPDSRRTPLVLRRRVDYHGFELEREIEPSMNFRPTSHRARAACSPKRSRVEKPVILVREKIRSDRIDSRDVSAVRRQDAALWIQRSRIALRGAAGRRDVDDGISTRAGVRRCRRDCPAGDAERYADCRRRSTCAERKWRFSTTSKTEPKDRSAWLVCGCPKSWPARSSMKSFPRSTARCGSSSRAERVVRRAPRRSKRYKKNWSGHSPSRRSRTSNGHTRSADATDTSAIANDVRVMPVTTSRIIVACRITTRVRVVVAGAVRKKENGFVRRAEESASGVAEKAQSSDVSVGPVFELAEEQVPTLFASRKASG
jgi:hypothetical protein